MSYWREMRVSGRRAAGSAHTYAAADAMATERGAEERGREDMDGVKGGKLRSIWSRRHTRAHAFMMAKEAEVLRSFSTTPFTAPLHLHATNNSM